MSPARLGAVSALLAVLLFSINDATIKFLSGGYALHEVVLIRSLIGFVIIVALIAPMTNGWAIMRTRRLGMHLLRGLLVVAANMLFFLGLAAMPLAEAVAIFFVSPLIITVFSVIFLGEKVGPPLDGDCCRLYRRIDHDASGHGDVSHCVAFSTDRGAVLCGAAHDDAADRAHGKCRNNGVLYPDRIYFRERGNGVGIW